MTPVEVAKKYIGQTEKPKNSGFTDAEFEKKMYNVGFEKGHAWCAYFQELVFKEAYPEKFEELNKLFSGSTIQTFNNFAKAGYPVSYVPEVGALVIWQMVKEGKPQVTGHAGIVSEVTPEGFKSIEGNTAQGGVREGFIVAEHNRKVLANVKVGLRIMGFIKI